jgi:CheY-like chemotaxis protein
MDVKMSDLDGLEATRRLRMDPATTNIPIIAVTASTLGDKRQAALEAGCTDYLAKPVRAELLFGTLQTHLGARFVHGGGTEVEAEPPDFSKTPRRAEIAVRLRQAITIGDVTDLEGLAQELVDGEAEEAILGHQIARLVSSFDFDGLRDLASTLGEEA